MIAAGLQGCSALAALLAAVFWFLSSNVPTPGEIGIYIDPPGPPMRDSRAQHYQERNVHSGDLQELAFSLAKQSRLSRWAAVAAGVSALCQAASFFL